MRERERESNYHFFCKLRETELFKGKIFNFLIPKSQKLFEIFKKKSLNILSNNIYNILNSMMEQSIFNFKNSKVSE